ncbi:xanthine phosphoribosyltransferase [Buchnera aphidicola]|uniref:xanthine phosphoribosyltransferase n=1 Tax=Buchnera aphidicola TaxID=9 RepID=UPI0031B82676
MSNKYIVTWKIVHFFAKKLALKLSFIRKWNKIIAVSRGGLIPATILGKELNIRYIDTICISSYNQNNNMKNLKIIKKSLLYDKDVLIVDDLVDTGRTAKVVRNFYKKSYFVTIFAKPIGKFFVDKYIIDIPQNIWVEFPWDI